MRIFSLIVLLLSSHLALAQVCGLYQYNDYGDRTSQTISDFQTMAPQTTNYQILNTEMLVVQRLVSGLCYCVDGEVGSDPTYPGDYLYKTLIVRKVLSGPLNTCHP